MTSPIQPQDDVRPWEQWVTAHGRSVRGYLRALLGEDDTADELTQEVFCRAWAARQRYQEYGNARAYLLRIADRLAVDHLRQRRREVNLDDEKGRGFEPATSDTNPVEELVGAEARQQLAVALEQLSPSQRRVLLLRYYGDLSFAEIAEVMHSPLGTVLSHCHRGLLALRKLLVELER